MKKLSLLLLAFVAVRAGVSASDQVVTDLGDSGLTPGQLRYAVSECQKDSVGGTITFAVAGTITLNNGGFVISTNVTLDGSNGITIAGLGANGPSASHGPAFFVNSGAALTLKRLTVSNFYGNITDGGAVFSRGTLNFTNCKFLNNEVASNYSGGAVCTYAPSLFADCEFGGNKGGGGGALYPRFGDAVVTVTRCNFHDNQTTNTADAGRGGAILVWDGPTVTITDSSFTNNHALLSGGAVRLVSSGKIDLTNTTFTQNTARNGGGCYVEGTSTSPA